MKPEKEENSLSGSLNIAWLPFAGFGILFVVYGVYAFTLIDAQPSHWDWITSDQQVVDYLGGTFKVIGMTSSGLGIMTVIVATGGFRKGERWAWYAFTVFPFFFLVAILFTWPGFMWLPLLIVSTVALLVTRRTVFAN